MNPVLKKYLVVSLTLGSITGGSALLIGLTNTITADRIVENAVKKENNGLKNVFTDIDGNVVEGQKFNSVELNADTSYTYVQKIWNVLASDDSSLGTIYKTSGKNAYGSVTLLLGFDTKKSFKKMVVLENTETYGSTLDEKYIKPLNAGEIELADTTCGATFGAKLIKAMVEEAKSDLGSDTDSGATTEGEW